MHFSATSLHLSITGTVRRLVLLVFILAWGADFAVAQSAASVSFEIAPAEPWVKPVMAKQGAQANPDTISGGIDYLMRDQQENFISKSSYYHQVRHVLTDEGVQNGSDITIAFDPTYQKLTFHFIRVTRAGSQTAEDRLDRRLFKVVQRETEMEYFLFDGRYTAQCVLEDIRVGDVIEYACTLEGANPVMGGKSCETFGTMWSVPVRHAVVRLLYAQDNEPRIKIDKKDITPVITSENGVTEWMWEEKDVPPRLLDGGVPTTYNPFGNVQVSDFADWGDVVDWAVALYPVTEQLTPELEAEVEKLRNIADTEERIMTALRFVQDEIRYLAVASGIHSHQPNAPDEVLRRRFGDCKDKTFLLATLLGKCGVSATPVLVNTSERKNVFDLLPSPYAFDHVILQVSTFKNTYWLDATRSNQRGPLNQIYVTDFGYGLVLSPGTKFLTPFKPPAASNPRSAVQEIYTVYKPGIPSTMEVVTDYRGASAEGIRATFKRESRDALQKSYLEYYARRFPTIKSRSPLTLTELPDEMGCQVRENYTIPELWQPNEKKTGYVLPMGSADIQNIVGDPIAASRVDPAGWGHPTRLEHEIQLNFYQDWALDGSPLQLATSAFTFDHKTSVEGRTVKLKYSYESLSDTIPLAEVPAHNEALTKITDVLNYTFTLQSEGLSAPAQQAQAFKVNWMLVFSTTVLVVPMVWLCLYIFRSTRQIPPLQGVYQDAHLDGLSGWLVLVGLHSITRPLFSLAWFVQSWWLLDQPRWDALTDPVSADYREMYLPTLMFEWLYNCAMLIFSVMLLIMYFKKRAWFRNGTIIVIAVTLVGILIDNALAYDLVDDKNSKPGEAFQDIIRGTVAALVWIPYMISSRRVRATFRR